MKSEIINNLKQYEIKIVGKKHKNQILELCLKSLDYFELFENSNPNEKSVENILTDLPPNSKYDDKYVFGVFDNKKELIALIDFVKGYKDIKECTLGLMLIAPIERNSGLGKKLHENLVEFAKKLDTNKIRIGVVENNLKALKFWKNLGYVKIEEKILKLGERDTKVIVMNYFI